MEREIGKRREGREGERDNEKPQEVFSSTDTVTR